jgi:hypothetical protein
VFDQRTEEVFAYFVLVFGEEEFSSVFDKLLHRHNTVVVVVHALESQGGVSLVETETTEKQFKFVFGDLTRLVFVKGLSKKCLSFSMLGKNYSPGINTEGTSGPSSLDVCR